MFLYSETLKIVYQYSERRNINTTCNMQITNQDGAHKGFITLGH